MRFRHTYLFLLPLSFHFPPPSSPPFPSFPSTIFPSQFIHISTCVNFFTDFFFQCQIGIEWWKETEHKNLLWQHHKRLKYFRRWSRLSAVFYSTESDSAHRPYVLQLRRLRSLLHIARSPTPCTDIQSGVRLRTLIYSARQIFRRIFFLNFIQRCTVGY